ncbi:hypothetical protein CSC03_2909 [Enterobacter hormaechei]|nr:hypothetical protein CSC03_2909 [Enterobacter hormaechei]
MYFFVFLQENILNALILKVRFKTLIASSQFDSMSEKFYVVIERVKICLK